jgi:hypothetical protein
VGALHEEIIMPWSINILPDQPIVETVYTGVLGHFELSQATMKTTDMVLTHGFKKRLANCSELEAGPPVGTLCLLGDELAKVPGARIIKQAVVLPVNAKAAIDVLFWETVCTNRAIPVRVFQDRHSALEWLSTGT